MAVFSLISALGGAVAIAVPFIEQGPSWQWRPRTPDELTGATVNAVPLALDERGMTLAPSGERPVSIISPPLTLDANTPRLLIIELAAAPMDENEVTPSPNSSAVDMALVRLLWQTEPVEGFKYAESEITLSTEPVRAILSLPEAPERIHRLGVQVANWHRPVIFSGIELANLSLSQRVATFTHQAIEREPLRNHSINLIRGPVMLGRGLNYYLAALIALCAGGYVLYCSAAQRGPDWRVPVGIVIAAWLIADVQATTNLARNVADEVSAYRGLSRAEQVALSDGPDIAWAYEQLLAHCPEGGAYAVVSDDPFTPAHRLDYLLAPQRTRAELNDAGPAYIVVIRSSELQFDAEAGVFQFREYPPAPATLVDMKSDAAYLLKRGGGR